MFALPRWYCPAGIARPTHLSVLATPVGCVPGVGPDVADAGPGGGMMYGGVFTPGESGWVKTEAGWYVNMVGVMPQVLARMDRNPRITRWTMVQGVTREHVLMVPVLLGPVFPDDAPTDGSELVAPIAYVSALDQVLTQKGWSDPTELAALQEQLRRVAITIGTEHCLDDPGLVSLAIELLMLGHQNVTRHEMIAGGWFSELVLLRVLVAAAGIPMTAGAARG
jgi:hypothetical protein